MENKEQKQKSILNKNFALIVGVVLGLLIIGGISAAYILSLTTSTTTEIKGYQQEVEISVPLQQNQIFNSTNATTYFIQPFTIYTKSAVNGKIYFNITATNSSTTADCDYISDCANASITLNGGPNLVSGEAVGLYPGNNVLNLRISCVPYSCPQLINTEVTYTP